MATPRDGLRKPGIDSKKGQAFFGMSEMSWVWSALQLDVGALVIVERRRMVASSVKAFFGNGRCIKALIKSVATK